jgi:hypothetical protein
MSLLLPSLFYLLLADRRAGGKLNNVRRLIRGLALILSISIPSVAQRNFDLKYDRIQLAENFLNALYPELGPHRLITIETEFGWVGSYYFYVGITPCRLGSGVPAGGYTHRLVESCPGPLQADASSFFMASIRLVTKKPYLRGYGAGGEFLSGRLDAWRKEIIKHPEWSEGDILDDLRRRNPHFGPADKDAFERTIPTDTIEQFSGCRLQPESAAFFAKRLGRPPDTDMQLGWTVNGKDRVKGGGCSAEFEPFEGRLVRLWTL